MTRALLLSLLVALHLGNAVAADCEGVVFLNETLMQFGRRMSETLPIDCHIPIEVDSSHCGFEQTPQYRVIHDDSEFYDCSFVVNPQATKFDLFCTFSEEYFVFLIPFSGLGVLGGQLRTASDGASNSSIGNRRLTEFGIESLPEDVVIRWVASPAGYLEECNDTIVNLTRQIDDLEDIIDNLRTTETTTGSEITTSGTTTSATSFVASTATKTTTTTTTMTAAPVDVVQAGATSDCDSLLLLLIISAALSALLILIITFLLLRLCKKKDYSSHVDASAGSDRGVISPEAATPSSQQDSVRPVGVRGPASSAGTGRVSFAPDSVGSGGSVNAPRGAVGQDGGDSWAGRSIVYRYLKTGTRSGNRIKADFRRGPVMRAVEAPQMDDAASAISGSASVSHASQGALSSGTGRVLNEPGESSAVRSRVPAPPPTNDAAIA